MEEVSTTHESIDRPAMVGRRVSLGAAGPAAMIVCFVVGLLGLGWAALVGYARLDGWRYFSHAYLVSYCFFATLSLGGLFFVAVQHVTHAGWSVTVRRLAEITGANFPVLGVLFLPILLPLVNGSNALYPWAAAHAVAHDPILAQKAVWLNPPMFALRTLGYLVVWVWLGRYFLVRSLRQDATGDARLTVAMQRMSPVALILFALTITFASFDWLMSLTPTWYSTIYGVYFFAGAAVAILAWIILVAMGLQATGRIDGDCPKLITVEHYHDLGKLLFAFVVFWGYIAFSQYLLIWYANIPEETQWYVPRHNGAWRSVSLVLLLGNLILPFVALLSRHVKRSKPLLAACAVWLLLMHWIDLYWLVMPSLSPNDIVLNWIDAGCFVGVGGLWLAGWFHLAGNRPLVPLADPRLSEALEFENV